MDKATTMVLVNRRKRQSHTRKTVCGISATRFTSNGKLQ